MKSGKPKTKRYQFGGTLRSQISGTRNAPPPKKPAPAPAKPTPPLVNPASMKPLPTEVRTADANTMPLDKTVYRSPAVPSKPTGLGAMPATPIKTTGKPFNAPPEIVNIPQTGRAPSTKISPSEMWDILSGRAPAPNIPSTPNKPPVEYVDDLAHIYTAAAKNQPQIFGPQAPMPAGGPRPSTMPATTATAKPAPLSPQYMKKGGAVKAYAKGGKVSSASSRGDGIAQRGKTRGKMV